jgi:hypothetical protein
MIFMKTQKPKTVKKQTIKKAVKKTPSKPKVKLSKADPSYYAKIGAISAAKRKLSKEFFSAMAVKSHAAGSRPDGYKGGRKKKEDTENA